MASSSSNPLSTINNSMVISKGKYDVFLLKGTILLYASKKNLNIIRIYNGLGFGDNYVDSFDVKREDGIQKYILPRHFKYENEEREDIIIINNNDPDLISSIITMNDYKYIILKTLDKD